MNDPVSFVFIITPGEFQFSFTQREGLYSFQSVPIAKYWIVVLRFPYNIGFGLVEAKESEITVMDFALEQGQAD